MGSTTSTAALIGVGRCDRGDAAAGLVVSDIVGRHVADRVEITAPPTSTKELIEMWYRHDIVFVVGAARPDARPGLIRRSEPLEQPDPKHLLHLPLDVDLGDAITIGHKMNRLPRLLVLYSIEGQRFTQRAGVSPEVASAAHDVAGCILAEIDALTATRWDRRSAANSG